MAIKSIDIDLITGYVDIEKEITKIDLLKFQLQSQKDYVSRLIKALKKKDRFDDLSSAQEKAHLKKFENGNGRDKDV